MERNPIIKTIINEHVKRTDFPEDFSEKEARKARRFHMSFDNYEATKLVSENSLAEVLGVRKIFIKDESRRWGLNAFKVLGGAYAVARLLCQKLDVEIEKVDFKYLKEEIGKKFGNVPFVTATDGNHGRGIAWSAKELGQKAIVFMPKGTAKRRVEAIQELGAEVIVTDLNYDDTVLLATEKAKEVDGFILQDTAWEGYTDIPTWIMQGYMTMAAECIDQMALKGYEKPTHLFVQAGVGGMAAAVLGYFVNRFEGDHPVTVVVEPHEAACIYKSAELGTGEAAVVEGDLKTIAVGLACGVPSPIAWPILRDYATMFASVDDSVAARGVRILANPLAGDRKVVSGESGAIGVGLLSLIMRNDELALVREKLQLNKDSVVLLINTEGDTDPVNYGQILWDGKFEMPKKVDTSLIIE